MPTFVQQIATVVKALTTRKLALKRLLTCMCVCGPKIMLKPELLLANAHTSSFLSVRTLDLRAFFTLIGREGPEPLFLPVLLDFALFFVVFEDSLNTGLDSCVIY